MEERRKLLIIGRAPIKGEAKTRLINEVGEKWAHRFYLAMLEDFFHNLSDHQACFHEIVLSIDPYNDVTASFFKELLDRHQVSKVALIGQKDAPFFERLDHLLNENNDGESSLHLTGTDVPSLNYGEICALTSNGHNYLGPDRDGGFYYGIFNKNAIHTFSRFFPSSPEQVFNELVTQVEACKSLDLRSDLDVFHDISMACDSINPPEHLKFVLDSYLLEQKRLLSAAESRA
jgi:glycosyltransferase A (GT-A) superfamily protein (DUF2064 family)